MADRTHPDEVEALKRQLAEAVEERDLLRVEVEQQKINAWINDQEAKRLERVLAGVLGLLYDAYTAGRKRS